MFEIWIDYIHPCPVHGEPPYPVITPQDAEIATLQFQQEEILRQLSIPTVIVVEMEFDNLG